MGSRGEIARISDHVGIRTHCAWNIITAAKTAWLNYHLAVIQGAFRLSQLQQSVNIQCVFFLSTISYAVIKNEYLFEEYAIVLRV